MLGAGPGEINGDVMDAIGELTNISAAQAKAQLEEYKLSIGLPTVICGKGRLDQVSARRAADRYSVRFRVGADLRGSRTRGIDRWFAG